MRRARRLLLAALVSALTLAGCVALPRSGPVTASDPQLPVPELGFAASGPRAGASPLDIVQGFVQASAAGLSDDFAVARQYLAGQAQRAWDPTAQVRVFASDEAIEYTRTETGAVEVRAPAQASVDDDGRYTEAAPDSTIESEFTLARDGQGEWRIIALEDGLLLSPAVFDALFEGIRLYFLSQDRQALVPDLRYVPQRNVVTSAVLGLLAGPSPWLAGGVVTALPSGTALTVGSVVVEEGVAQVDLTDELYTASAADQALATAQIEATLANVASVRSTEITVAGAELDLPAPDPTLLRDSFVQPTVVLLADGGLAQYSGGDELRELVPPEQLEGREPTEPAMGYGDDPLVVVRGGTSEILAVDGGELRTLTRGESLLPPSVDRHGWVWTGEGTNGGELRAVAADGAAVRVAAPWLAGTQVRSVKVSRDGARAVVVSAAGGVVQVAVTAVARETDGQPAALGEPVRLAERLDDATDVTWVDEVTLAILGTARGASGPAVHLVPVGGPSAPLPAVSGATSVTAARGDRTLVVGTGEGELYVRSGATWRLAVESGVRDPAYPG